MTDSVYLKTIASWTFGVILIAIGLLNLIFVHPVPGLSYLAFSCIFLPPVDDQLKLRFHLWIPMDKDYSSPPRALVYFRRRRLNGND